MDSSKCYNRKKDGQYLGKFVRTEHDYPDGPGRGGSTDHYFIKDGKQYKVPGSWVDSDDYQETPCTGNVVLEPVPKSSLFTKAVPSSNCFVADKENGKYVCPECKAVEGGSKRIITHNFNCKNKSMPRYCQQGAKRSRTKKSKRSKSRSKKARKTRRSNK
jgi:hypothetical protein